MESLATDVLLLYVPQWSRSPLSVLPASSHSSAFSGPTATSEGGPRKGTEAPPGRYSCGPCTLRRSASSESNLSSAGFARGRSGYFATWIASSKSSISSGAKLRVRKTTSFTSTCRSTAPLITSSVSVTTCGRVGRNSSSEPASDTRLKVVITYDSPTLSPRAHGTPSHRPSLSRTEGSTVPRGGSQR